MAAMLSRRCCCSQIGAEGSGGSLLVCYQEVVSDMVSRCQVEVEEGPQVSREPSAVLYSGICHTQDACTRAALEKCGRP